MTLDILLRKDWRGIGDETLRWVWWIGAWYVGVAACAFAFFDYSLPTVVSSTKTYPPHSPHFYPSFLPNPSTSWVLRCIYQYFLYSLFFSFGRSCVRSRV
ncbi:hypothetical protein EDD15DRAFT_2251080, partial [Pisolithus albus]